MTGLSTPLVDPQNVTVEDRPMDAGGVSDLAPADDRQLRRGVTLKMVLILLDLAAAASVCLAVYFGGLLDGRNDLTSNVLVFGSIVGTTIGACVVLRLYQARVSSVRSEEISRLLKVAGAAGIVAVIVTQAQDRLFPVLSPFDGLAIVVMLFTMLVIGRAGFDAWLRHRRTLGQYCRNIIIVGTGPEALDLAQIIRDHPELGYRVAGLIGVDPGALPDGVTYLGDIGAIDDAIDRCNVNGVLMVTETMPPPMRNALVKQLVSRGIHVHLSPGVQGFTYRRLRMVPIAYEPLLYLEPPDHSRFQLFLKRALDLALASIALVIFAIPLAILMVLVRLQDRGPAIFRQERVGLNGELFTFLKLRTMVVDAEAKRAAIAESNERNGPLFKAANDPRVTRLGRILRATSLDELPQLINVLRGDMSLVGPRPCLPTEAAEFDDALSLRYEVRPGVTGLWQVEARDNPVFRAYRRFDLFYVENWTVGLDLVILVLTLQNVVSRGVSAVLRRTGPSSESPASALP